VGARARGAVVLTGDIGRAFLPRDRFVELDARDFGVLAGLESTSVKRAMVWAPAW
jgi:predicted nicotinamide N-methyase